MPIDRDEVKRIAALAHLDLSSEQVEQYQHQLDAILGYVARLDALDVTDTEPSLHASGQGPGLREDQPRPSTTVEQALGNAPETAEGCFFRVPPVIDR